MEILPIKQTKNVQETVKQVVDALKNGDIQVGDTLPSERTLALKLQISRSSLREALSVLEMMGLIKVRQGGKTVVAPFDLQPLMKMFSPLFSNDPKFDEDLQHFRLVLECDAVTLACQREDFIDLQKIVSQMEESVAENESIAAHLDIAFHREIFRLADNSILIKTMDWVENLLLYSVLYNRTHILQSNNHARTLLDQHRSICADLIRNDIVSAATHMKEHLEFVRTVQKESKNENISVY